MRRDSPNEQNAVTLIPFSTQLSVCYGAVWCTATQPHGLLPFLAAVSPPTGGTRGEEAYAAHRE